MNKKYLNVILFSALIMGTTGTFTSCKDYDDDISNLQTQIDANKVTLDELKSKIDGGFVITKCEKNDEGVLITFSNGQTCQLYNGAKGENGGAGKDAAVWTIDKNDGYWYKDGTKTEYKAIGSDGVGAPGQNGENGWYYKPNAATGCFDIYQLDADGKEKFIKATDISWKVEGGSANGISVVLNGNTLTVDGAIDKNGEVVTTPIEISLGQPLGSVAFVPDVIDATINYPTTTDEFYHLATYWDETKYDATTKALIDQVNFDKSNAVEMVYRLNPTNAYTENAVLGFINREVTTRAIAGDKQTLLNVVPAEEQINDGSAIISATVNASKLSATPKHNLAALQVFVGQVPVTSDYIVVKSTPIDVKLADSVKTVVGADAVEFYPRLKSIVGLKENDAFIKTYVTLADAANFDFKYENNGKPGEIDLNKKVGLYTNDKLDYLYALGFTGMSYEFSLPEEYKGDDAQQTNQQWFIREKSEGVFAVDETHLTEGLTSAIGRTPVVRVDAYLTNNKGAKRLVASSYIKLRISETDSKVKETNLIEIADENNLIYQNLKATNTKVAQMEWQRINNEMYSKESLTATTFWKNYGGANRLYEVMVTALGKDGKEIELLKNSNVHGGTLFTDNTSIPGIALAINLNESDVQTSDIRIDVNNKVHTDSYARYKDVDGKGAEYTVTITIKANDNTAHGDFILTQLFHVKDNHKPYVLNELYQIPGQNSVEVKGQLNPATSTWEMSSVVSEHFEKIAGENVFTYWKKPAYVNAAGALRFEWDGETGVTPIAAFTTDQAVALDGAMTKDTETKVMTYAIPLANGEECVFKYNIIFVNPFKKVAPSAVKLYGNGIGENTVDVRPQVNVVDREGDLIYSWDNIASALVLSSKATGTYHVAAPTVTYDFYKKGDYETLTSQMSAGSNIDVDANGTVIWENQGTTLQKDLHLTVIATVTFEDLSEVTINIPVTLTKNK